MKGAEKGADNTFMRLTRLSHLPRQSSLPDGGLILDSGDFLSSGWLYRRHVACKGGEKAVLYNNLIYINPFDQPHFTNEEAELYRDS